MGTGNIMTTGTFMRFAIVSGNWMKGMGCRFVIDYNNSVSTTCSNTKQSY